MPAIVPIIEENAYTLYRHKSVLGHLTVTEIDFPWISCTFTPEHEFESVQDTLARFRAVDIRHEQKWEQARQEVRRLGFVIEPASAQETAFYPEVLLYIKEGTATFRFSSTPNAQYKPKRLPFALLPLWRAWALFRWRFRK